MDSGSKKKKRSGEEIDRMREEVDVESHLDALRRGDGNDLSWQIALPSNLEDLLSKWESIKDENVYTTVMFAWRLYDITLSVLKEGCTFDTMSEESIRKGLRRWIKIVEGFRVYNRNQISKYSVTDTFEKFSVDTLYFICQCNLLMILEKCFPDDITKKMPREKDYHRLTSNRIMMFDYRDKNVTNFNESEVMISLIKLSQVWNETHIDYSIERFIDGIIIRIARMLTNFEDGFSDGSITPNGIPDKDFFSDVSSMTSHMKTCFYVSRDEKIRKETISMIGKSVCEGYNIDSVYSILADGFMKDIQFWNQETYGKAIKSLVYNVSMRPGEEQRFARQNGGIFTKEATDILELYRTDIQWDNIYDKMLKATENIPTSISRSKKAYYEKDRDRGYVSCIKNPTILKIFDMLCNTECNLQWVANCVILEKDISYHYKKLSMIRYPVVIQMAGEFNVLFNKYLYETVDVEIALAVWVIIVIKLLKAKLFIDGTAYTMNFLYDKIQSARIEVPTNMNESELDKIDALISNCQKSVGTMEINVL